MIYREFRTWRKGTERRLYQLLNGFYGLLFNSLIMGIVSLLIYAARQVNAFFRRETIAAGIVSCLVIALSVGWLTTFVKERHKRVEIQHRADSLAYGLSKFTQMYDSTEAIVINGDTIRHAEDSI